MSGKSKGGTGENVRSYNLGRHFSFLFYEIQLRKSACELS